MKKNTIVKLLIVTTITIVLSITFGKTYSKYVLTKNNEATFSSLPFYFGASTANDKVNCDINNNATILLNILNYEGNAYNSFTTEFEITIEENSKLNLVGSIISDSIEGSKQITKPMELILTTTDNLPLQSEEIVTIKIVSTKPYSKEIKIPVTILPSEKRELTIEELRDIAENHLGDNFTGMKAFDVYGDEIENAQNLWLYEKRQSDNSWELNTDDRYAAHQAAYIGDIVDGTIIGQIPAYIIDRIDGTIHEGPVTSCKGIFAGLSSLTHLEDDVRIPQFLVKMEYCFRNTGLTQIPKGFLKIPENVETIEGLFAYSQIKNVPDNFTLGSHVENIDELFRDTPITSIPESFAASLSGTITTCEAMFRDCSQLKALPSNFQFPVNVKDLTDIFRGCSSLASVSQDLKILDGVTSVDSLFRDCTSLQSIPETFVIPSSMQNMRYLFYDCNLIPKLPDDFSIPQGVTTLEGTFYGCSSLEVLPDNLTVPNSVTTMKSTFSGCSSLKSLPQNFSIGENVEDLTAAFSNCSELVTIPNLVIPKAVQTIEDLIRECLKLEGQITLEGIPSNYYKAFYNTARNSTNIPFVIYYPPEYKTEAQAMIDDINASDYIHKGNVEFKAIGT